MGWTFTWSFNGDRKSYIDNLFTWKEEGYKEVSVIKSAMVGTVWYGALLVKNFHENTEEIMCECVLTAIDRHDGSFGYKEIGSAWENNYCDCPKSIIDLIPDTDDQIIAWKKRCAEMRAEKNSPDALKNLPLGSVIEFMFGSKTCCAVKMAPNHQFKSYWWKNVEEPKYFKRNQMPKTYTIIQRGACAE